jgi:hypothetical protein
MNSIKNNKKNPIDELFRHKLMNLEVITSEDNKLRFLDSIKNKKNKAQPIWYFSAAASILLISSISWFWLLPNSNNVANSNIEIVSEEPKSSINLELSEKEKSISTLKEFSSSSNESKTMAFSKAKTKQVITDSKPLAKINIAIRVEGQKSLTGVSEIDELIQDQLTVALQEAEKKRTLSNTKESKIEPNNDLFQKSIGETVVIVSSDLDINNDIYLPDLNSDSPLTLAEATDLGIAKMDEDRSLFAKVFTELKHLKHVEKISLNSLTASSETSILNNEDSFIGHETMEFRQRFNWLKGKLTKE